jgi:tRNA (cytidine/uridine-2'-O-)-methyltransferase
VRLALYQPDIPQNLGAAIRLTACMGVPLDIVEPCGFPLTDRALKRAAMDYVGAATITRHASLVALRAALPGRLVLVETGGTARLERFAFEPADTLVLGRESAGSPPELWEAADASVRLPMAAGLRSLNVVTAAAMALWEAMRQTGGVESLE